MMLPCSVRAAAVEVGCDAVEDDVGWYDELAGNFIPVNNNNILLKYRDKCKLTDF